MLFDAVYPANSDSIYTSKTGYSDAEINMIKEIQNTKKVVKYITKINATKTTLK